MRICVCPGSFDPVTYGHVDIIERASHLFDQVYVAVLVNLQKTPLFTVEERIALLKDCVSDLPNVKVESFNGLVVDYAHQKEAIAIVRGLRAVTDFEYELKTATMNRNLNNEIETVFLMTNSEYSFLSSSIVKEVASFGGDVSKWVSPTVEHQLRLKYNQKSHGGDRQ